MTDFCHESSSFELGSLTVRALGAQISRAEMSQSFHQDEEGDVELEQVLRESADRFALKEELRELRGQLRELQEQLRDLDTNSNSSFGRLDVDEDTAFAIALEISKEETTNQTQTEAFDNQDFTEEEILKISEIESNQDNNFTMISCLRNDATDECIFCLEVPVRLEVVRRLRCMHVFHKDCFDEYFEAGNNEKNTCPICKEAVIENTDTDTETDTETDEE